MACKVSNRVQQETMQQTERVISAEALTTAQLGGITKAVFESKMAMDGFKHQNFVLTHGWEMFQAAFAAKSYCAGGHLRGLHLSIQIRTPRIPMVWPLRMHGHCCWATIRVEK